MKTLWSKNQKNPSDRISHAWAPLKGDLSIDNIVNPPLFSLVNIFKEYKLQVLRHQKKRKMQLYGNLGHLKNWVSFGNKIGKLYFLLAEIKF
jgi:hypothetical protein